MPKGTLGKLLLLTAVSSFAFWWGCSDKPGMQEAVAPTPAPSSPGTTAEVATPEVSTETIYFDFDRSFIRDSAKAVLQGIADHMKANPTKSLQIEGHCDERGTTEYNLALGLRRATSVKKFLTGLGVSPGSITTISFGEEKPAVEGHDESAWRQNRRAEFKLSM